ncbi:MAG: hypothetical protein V4654_01775 [Bdellovibrionota bacterium]
MKSILKNLIMSAILCIAPSVFAGTSALNCKVKSIHALEDDNDQYAEVVCASGTLSVFAKSDSVKSILISAKVSNGEINISVESDDAFKKTGTLHKIQRVELN